LRLEAYDSLSLSLLDIIAMSRNLYRFLSFTIFFLVIIFSCKKENDNHKILLQQHNWEQLGQLSWDSSYYEHKFFHTLRFNADDTYFMETNWSLSDTLIYTESGPYEYDSDDEIINFPYAIDTIDEGSLFLRIYLSPWHILQLDDTLMIVKSEPDYQPPDDPGGTTYYEDETIYFRQKHY
jgi:hypothetical protein